MSSKKSHSTMFMAAPTAHGFIQCTIKPEYQDYFEELGFVDDLDKMKDSDLASAKASHAERIDREEREAKDKLQAEEDAKRSAKKEPAKKTA